MRYAHTNIVSRNWRRLAEFYIKVFDCVEKPPRRNLSGDWLDQATGLNNARLEGMHLMLPGHGENGPTLEIFSYRDMQAGEPIQANCTGFTHIAFEVANVADTLVAALEMGASKLGEITRKEVTGMGILEFIYFRDPDGNIVEIQSWER